MAPRRVRPPARPVQLTLDGRPLQGDADASLASALLGQGEWALARSPKFHRPRGPSCMRGGCDGCLMRVDDVPNVMTCLVPCREGARVERQNVVLSAKLDVLRVTDWFFPHGMNHHEMFAGIPGVQTLMQTFARRLSGLGELPDRPAGERPPLKTIEVDVLVVGAGIAGVSVAHELVRRGRTVRVCDDRATPGGGALSFIEPAARDEALALGDALYPGTTALGVLEGHDWLLAHTSAAGAAGLTRVTARAHVVAAGAHDATPEFPGNDLPGVLSARAALGLLSEGVLVGSCPIVTGDGPWARAFSEAARGHGVEVRRVHAVTEARGLSQVKGALVVEGRGAAPTKIDADAILHDDPPAPCFELAVQAGGRVLHRPAGYAVEVDPRGRAATDAAGGRLYAVGEVTGMAFDPTELRARARAVGRAIHEDLA